MNVVAVIPVTVIPTKPRVAVTAAKPQPRSGQGCGYALSSVQIDKGVVAAAITSAFAEFGPKVVSEAILIASKESGLRTNALSGTCDFGVFQINCRWQSRRAGGDCSKFYDLNTNIAVAKQIYREQKWYPWVTKKFLPR